MPIEIKELHIRITVNSASSQQQAGNVGTVGGGSKEEKESIVAECVEQVLLIVENKRER